MAHRGAPFLCLPFFVQQGQPIEHLLLVGQRRHRGQRGAQTPPQPATR